MNNVLEKMYFNNREIVLVEKEECDESVVSCCGCVLEREDNCIGSISPSQPSYICCPKHTGKYYVFKFLEEGV